MWVRADGGLINCDHFIKLKVVKRQDGKFFVMGISNENNYPLSEHKNDADAESALTALLNRLNRERK